MRKTGKKSDNKELKSSKAVCVVRFSLNHTGHSSIARDESCMMYINYIKQALDRHVTWWIHSVCAAVHGGALWLTSRIKLLSSLVSLNLPLGLYESHLTNVCSCGDCVYPRYPDILYLNPLCCIPPLLSKSYKKKNTPLSHSVALGDKFLHPKDSGYGSSFRNSSKD